MWKKMRLNPCFAVIISFGNGQAKDKKANNHHTSHDQVGRPVTAAAVKNSTAEKRTDRYADIIEGNEDAVGAAVILWLKQGLSDQRL